MLPTRQSRHGGYIRVHNFILSLNKMVVLVNHICSQGMSFFRPYPSTFPVLDTQVPIHQQTCREYREFAKMFWLNW